MLLVAEGVSSMGHRRCAQWSMAIEVEGGSVISRRMAGIWSDDEPDSDLVV